jgi:RNA polymerase sigma-70 factor (ECF subfamily)
VDRQKRAHLRLVQETIPHDPLAEEDALLARLAEGDTSAAGALFDLHGAHVERILFRILGTDSELSDLVHEVFLRALRGIPRLKDPRAFAGWLQRVAVSVAMDLLRARRRRRWLFFLPPEALPELVAPHLDHEARDALLAVYAILDQLPPEDRVAFSLRFLEGLDLSAVADACGCSLATAKRRVSRAQTHLFQAARQHPVLAPWAGAREP